MKDAQTETDIFSLDALSGAERYYRWILSHFIPHLRGDAIEVGAGVGTFSDAVLQGTNLPHLTLIDPDTEHYSYLAKKYAGNPRVSVKHGYLERHASSLAADAVIAVNVLEHVEDDNAFLRSAHQVLRPKGSILLFVPALEWLYGSIDRFAGHYRRYDKRSLKIRLEKAGFCILRLIYFNAPGILTWFLAARVLRVNTVSPLQARIYDRWVVSWLSRLEKAWEPPLGQSLIAVGQK